MKISSFSLLYALHLDNGGQSDKTLDMKAFYLGLFLCGLVVALTACNSLPTSTPAFIPESTSTKVMPSITFIPTQTPIPPSPTSTAESPTMTPAPSRIELPTKTPSPACVVLYYGEYAQFELIDPVGRRVLVDIYDPAKLSSRASASDILLTTHSHWDHLNENFQASFPGMQLFVQTGMLDTQGVVIQGIASAHNIGDRLKPRGGTNYIYLIEMGSLRIAHFGDIGQETLTNEQLTTLGRLDIAITQINNPYSEMNAENRKGINLIEQVQPRLVIPTHLNLDTVKLASRQWRGYFAESSPVKICESDLSREGTSFLILGESAAMMRKYVELTVWVDSES